MEENWVFTYVCLKRILFWYTPVTHTQPITKVQRVTEMWSPLQVHNKVGVATHLCHTAWPSVKFQRQLLHMRACPTALCRIYTTEFLPIGSFTLLHTAMIYTHVHTQCNTGWSSGITCTISPHGHPVLTELNHI